LEVPFRVRCATCVPMPGLKPHVLIVRPSIAHDSALVAGIALGVLKRATTLLFSGQWRRRCCSRGLQACPWLLVPDTQGDDAAAALYLGGGYVEVGRDTLLGARLKGVRPRVLMRKTLSEPARQCGDLQ
jgi:hypothetical protein